MVDLVIPSCFFCTDFGADKTEWVELAHDTPVRIYAGIEEAYRAGHTGHLDVSALDYGTQPRLLLLRRDDLRVADDLTRGADRLERCRLWLH